MGEISHSSPGPRRRSALLDMTQDSCYEQDGIHSSIAYIQWPKFGDDACSLEVTKKAFCMTCRFSDHYNTMSTINMSTLTHWLPFGSVPHWAFPQISNHILSYHYARYFPFTISRRIQFSHRSLELLCAGRSWWETIIHQAWWH